MIYELRYKRPAEKYFKKLKDKGLIRAYREALTRISISPHEAGERKTGDLAGIYCCDVFYNKTNYEIAYQIFEADGIQEKSLELFALHQNCLHNWASSMVCRLYATHP